MLYAMYDNLVLRVVARGLTPFILLYGIYVQMHGEISPGGGFQAGAILASAMILYALVFGLKAAEALLPITWLKTFSCIGMLLYGGVGVASMLMGGEFLNYTALKPAEPILAQMKGIMLIEMGVGITVFSVLTMIFILFAQQAAPKGKR